VKQKSKFKNIGIYVAFILIIFSAFIQNLIFNNQLNVLNEVGLLILIFYSLNSLFIRKSIHKIYLPLFVFYFYLVLISIGSKYSDGIIIFLQSFMHIEFFILFIALKVINQTYNWKPERMFRALALISLIGAILSLVFPNLFLVQGEAFDSNSRVEGFQLNSNALGIFLAYYVFYLGKTKLYQNHRLEFLLSLIIVMITGSRTAILILLIAFIFSNQSLFKKGVIVSVAVGLIVIFASNARIIQKSLDNANQISNVSESSFIRGILLFNAYDLAVDNFPFGTGAGSFASALSRNSDLYSDLGLLKYQSIREGSALNDSNAAAIIGEFGFLTFLLYFIMVIFFLKDVSDRLKYRQSFGLIMPFFLIAVFSPFLRGFFSSTYYGLAFCLTFYSVINFYDKNSSSKGALSII
jgi:hypothetical protein